MSLECPCGFKLANPQYPVYCRCGRIHRGDSIVKRDSPPLWVAAVSRLKKEGDRGVGDTVQRVASWLGGELFKKWSQKLGIPCNCTRRQQEWNERWPYS